MKLAVIKHIARISGAFVLRNRVKIFDAGFALTAVAVATLFAFEVDVFETEGATSAAKGRIELNELMIITTVIMTGVLFYTWRRSREHKRENAKRIAAEQEVLSLAMQDPLTGLPNRRQFNDALKAALQKAPSHPEAHAIFLLDLNGFKKVNDVHGHPVGDQLLIHVSARLMRAAREGDLVARLGGDEFAIIAHNVAGAEGAANLALRFIDCFALPFAIDSSKHLVGTALGVSLAPHDGATAEELLRKADVALYRAKAEKKSAVRFFEEQMDARLHERDELEKALHAGLANDTFFVRFQPAVRVVDGEIASFETLPRWRHPSLGELGPERFFPVAEEAGALVRVIEHLLAKACLAATTWPGHVRLAFNLPGPLLADQAMALKILSVLNATGLSPRRLDLEIDEGALIREAEAAEPLLKQLRAAGVSLVADHFGTGYSNLQNLHRLELDRIKIDPSFVRAMDYDRKAAAMVRAFISIGKGLDIPVVADGVVTLEQQAALAEQGCVDAQGDLIGGAVDEREAQRLVSTAGLRRVTG